MTLGQTKQTRHIHPGDIVKGRFADGEWYLAEVKEDAGDGSYVVAWLDGDTSDCVKRSHELRAMRFDRQLQCYREDCTEPWEPSGAAPASGSLPRADGPGTKQADRGAAQQQRGHGGEHCDEIPSSPAFGMELYNATRRHCSSCACEAFQLLPDQLHWNSSIADAACVCGCPVAAHTLVDAAIGTSHAGSQFEVALPKEALAWNQRELGLFLSSRGRFHPPRMAAKRRSFGCSRTGCCRVSIVSHTSESRQEFHKQLWLVFDAQEWPDKELIVVETYTTNPSAFFTEKAKDDDRIVHVALKAQHEDELSTGLLRNMCAHLASGKYLSNFGDANLYAPNYVAEMVGAMQKQQKEAITLARWFALDPSTGDIGHVDPLAALGQHNPCSADFWLLGCGFVHTVNRKLALRLGYPHQDRGEDFELFRRVRLETPQAAAEGGIATYCDDAGICLHTLRSGDCPGAHDVPTVPSTCSAQPRALQVARLQEALPLYLRSFPRALRAPGLQGLGVRGRCREFRVCASWGEEGPVEVFSITGPAWATAAHVRALVAQETGCQQESIQLYRGIRPRGAWMAEGPPLRDSQRIDPRTSDLWAMLRVSDFDGACH